MTDLITHALQSLLNAKKIEGKVEYLPLAYEGSTKLDHLYVVHGIPIPVCTVHFTGNANVPEERLIKGSRDLISKAYSRSSISAFAGVALFPVYRELGQLRAQFGRSMATMHSGDPCGNGVDVTIPVDEGLVYNWDNAEWSGNKVYTSAELDQALAMKAGEVANGLKFDQGIKAVQKLYGRKGYLTLGLKPTAVFDDQAHKVEFRMALTEGPQFRMGNLIVKGLPDNQTNLLRGKWEILKGDIYDAGYEEDFFKTAFREVFRTILEERQSQGKPRPEVATNVRINRAELTVDVTIEFSEKKEQ